MIVKFNGEEYVCYTEREREEEVKDQVSFDLSSVNKNTLIYYIEDEVLRMIFSELADEYIANIREEDERLEEEIEENNCEDEQEYFDYLVDSMMDEGFDYLEDNFGYSEAIDMVELQNGIDYEGLVSEIISVGEAGLFISSYDNEEYEIEIEDEFYYAYRV